MREPPARTTFETFMTSMYLMPHTKARSAVFFWVSLRHKRINCEPIPEHLSRQVPAEMKLWDVHAAIAARRLECRGVVAERHGPSICHSRAPLGQQIQRN
eukprot:5463946-Pyramimonas_sp.AAC.1